MNHLIASLFRRNRRAFAAALISYLLVAGQTTPLVLASARPPARSAASQTAPPAGGTPSSGVTAAAPAAAPLAPAAVLVPNITATKVDTVIAANGVDPDPDGIADPDQLIEYQVTITNNGTEATNVTFNDTVDANTTLQAGTVASSPLAYSDSYSVIGNVRIQPNAAQGLLVNDQDPDTGNNTGMTVSAMAGDSSAPFSGTSTGGGQVTSSATDGSFVYNPAPGFSGSDTFTYTATDSSGKTGTATVTLNVSAPIWFIDDNAAAGGDGRLTNPYNCYTGTSVPAVQTCFSDSAPDDPGDIIFLFSGNYTGGYALLNNQQLIGQGATATLAAIAGVTVQPYSDPLPPTGGAAPVITTTVPGTNAVNIGVGNSNNLRGFSVGNTTGAKIASTASGFGTLTVSEVTLGGNGQALNLDSGTLAATFISISSNTSGAQGINLDQVAGSLTSAGGTSVTDPTTQCILVTASTANLTFNNTSCTLATDGISLQNNSAGTRAFGTLSVSGGSGIGFLHANGGGTTTFGGAVTITNPTGNGIDIQNSNVNLSFPATSVDKGTTANTGVNLVSNATRTITFSTLDINTNGGVGLIANNSGAVNVTNAAGSEITSTGNAAMVLSAGTALGLNFTLVQSTNSTGKGVELNAVTGGIGVATTTITNPTNIGLHALSNTTATAGTFSFGNTAVTQFGNTAVRLEGNAKAITFGDLDITTPDSSQRGLHATTNSGTITTTSGDITTTTGVPVEIVGTSSGSRTPLNMTLNKVSANGASNGIILTNVNGPGASVGFVVNGDGSNTAVGGNDSGGVIQNTAGGDDDTPTDNGGIGVRLHFADEVVLRRMTLTTQANFGIFGQDASNVIFEFSKVNGTNGTAAGINNTINSDASVAFNELTGAALFKDSIIEGGLEDNVRIINTGSTVLNRVVFNNVTVGVMDLGNTSGDNGMLLQARNTATMNVTIQDSDFTHARGDIMQFDLTDTASGDLIFDNNTVNNQHPSVVTGGGGISLSGGGSATAAPNLTYEFDNNTFRGARGSALLILWQTGSGSASGRIAGNTFGANGVDKSGSSEASTIEIRTEGRGAHTTLIDNNQIRQYAAFGIYMEMDGINTAGSTGTIGALNATITNNLIEQPNTAPVTNKNGIHLNHGATSGDTYSSCVDIRTNTTGSAGNEASVGQDILLRRRMLTNVRLPGYAGASNDVVAVENFIAGQNTGVESVNALTDATAGGYLGGAACTQPPAGAVFFNAANMSGDDVGGSSTLGSPEQTSVTNGGGATSFGGGVTSQPFVSMPLGSTQTTSAQTGNTLAPASQQSVTTTEQGSLADAAEVTPANPPVISGNNINWNIGTLQQGQSVTITFRVKVNNPYAGGPNVSNQGTVTCTECSGSVSTDDPAANGASDPTLTPINAPPDIVVHDASGPEPPSGSSPMAFTVVLSKAAATNVTVSFTTAEDTGGTDPATEGTDFTPTSGTLTFTPGQTVQTVSVPILADADAPEPDETFLVQLTTATGGNITDGEAVGTITNNNPAGALLISELRTFGPSGATQAGDDFVEVYNNSDSPHTVADGSGINDAAHGYGLFRMGGTCTDMPVLVGVIPNGTVIPARGHYLFVGSQYSLAAAAPGDQTMTSDLPENANVGLFKTAAVANLSTATRLDAVGFSPNTTGNNCDLLREGGALPQAVSGTPDLGQHSFYRSLCSFVNGVGCTVANPGFPSDRNDNASDFLFVDTNATSAAGTSQQRLGAPGPENMGSPRVNDQVGVFMLDASKSSTVAPNRVRKQCTDPTVEECDPNRSKLGTMSIRRRFINNTTATITQLRVRVAELTSFPRLNAATADVRPITSTDVTVGGINDSNTCGAAPLPCSVTVKGTTVQAPAQPNGGGYNTTMIVTLPGGGLPVGQSISLHFLLGVQESGSFRFLLNVEALP